MRLIELITKAGERLKYQRLDSSFVKLNIKKRDAEITFATQIQHANDLSNAVMLGKTPEYVGIVIWVPADCFSK